ncbi:unnamed protein product, partial [Prorocentrum cordatum]
PFWPNSSSVSPQLFAAIAEHPEEAMGREESLAQAKEARKEVAEANFQKKEAIREKQWTAAEAANKGGGAKQAQSAEADAEKAARKEEARRLAAAEEAATGSGPTGDPYAHLNKGPSKKEAAAKAKAQAKMAALSALAKAPPAKKK